MKLVFYYDYVCPFCLLATERIREIAEEFGLKVEWTGIEIHPEIPTEGRKRKKTERTVRISENLRAVAEEDGVDLKLPGFLANSGLCLQAAEFAKEVNRFEKFHKSCYEAYFEKGENIGALETVVEIGRRAGLRASDLRDTLEKGTFAPKTEQNMESAKEKMVFGVPTVYLNGFRAHGAQSRETYRKLIVRELGRRDALH